MTQRRRWIRFALPAMVRSRDGFRLTGELAKPNAVLEQIWNTLLRSPSKGTFLPPATDGQVGDGSPYEIESTQGLAWPLARVSSSGGIREPGRSSAHL